MVFTTYGNFHFVASLLSALLICVAVFVTPEKEGQWRKETGKGLSMAFEQNYGKQLTIFTFLFSSDL